MSEKILIIGGGFAGLKLAKKLSNQADKHVTLIDKVNHHMFQPMFYQVASGKLDPSNISFPFRKVFQKSNNVEFRLAEVQQILPEEKKVICNTGEFVYDKLIIATGCKTNFFGNKELEEASLVMKTTSEAIQIRNTIISKLERIVNAGGNVEEADWNIVVVGAGPTGVELCGALIDMKNEILPKDYPHFDFSKLKVILINSSSNVLAVMSPASQEKSEEFLSKAGVVIYKNSVATGYKEGELSIRDKESIPTNTIIWAAGVTGNVVSGLPEDSIFRNRYVVDQFSQVKGSEDIFAIGDISYMETEKYPKGHPQLGSVALTQAATLAKNILTSKQNWKKYEYADKGTMATVSKFRAVVELPFWKSQGALAWFFWMFLHVVLLHSLRSKLAVILNWTVSMFGGGNSALRLLINPAQKESSPSNTPK